MNVKLYIENVKLDLFSDENIEIKSNVQNANDITKNTVDFSKDFTVPASEINNKIFKHYYNVDIDNGFDARVKSSARIEIDGIDYKFGKIELLSVKLKRGKPSSYQIVFYGNGVSLKDLIGNDELSDLDLSAFDHDYNDTNVYNAFAGGWLFNKAIIYPFIAAKQYYYNSIDSSQESANVSNISNHSNANGVLWSSLKPALQLIKIIEAIEVKYGFTFSRDFFGRSEFQTLYMWLSADNLPILKTKSLTLEFNAGDFTYLLPGNKSFNLITTPTQSWEFFYRLEPKAGFENVPYTIRCLSNGDVIKETGHAGISTTLKFKLISSPEQPTSDNIIEVIVFSSSNFEFNFLSTQRRIERIQDIGFDGDIIFLGNEVTETNTQSINNVFSTLVDISNNIPKLKIIDFLKGLFSMYKLVVIQDKETDPIYVNDLNSYYAEANLFDVTPYISKKEHEVKRGHLLNEISYKFEEPTTITAVQFKKNNSIAYGDEELKLTQDGTRNGIPIEGGKEEIKVPFEQLVYIPLTDENNLSLNVQYGSVLNESSEPTSIKPHIFHNQFQKLNFSKPFKFVNTNFTTRDVLAVNMPSYVDGLFSTIFGSELNPYTGSLIENTLFKKFHEKYILSIFNNKRRDFIFKAKLPLAVINSLELKDVLKIYDNYYRINSYTFNLLTGDSKLELLNSFDEVINGFTSNISVVNTDFAAKTLSITVTNFVNLIFTNSTAWISNINNVGNIVYFDVSENATGLLRVGTFIITNQTTFEDIEITVNQDPDVVTADNNTITADNNIITADNG